MSKQATPCTHTQYDRRSCETCELLRRLDEAQTNLARFDVQWHADQQALRSMRAELEAAQAQLREHKVEGFASFHHVEADVLAAACDEAVRRKTIGERSLIADCRLDYGDPFTQEQVEAILSKYRNRTGAAADGGEYDATLRLRARIDEQQREIERLRAEAAALNTASVEAYVAETTRVLDRKSYGEFVGMRYLLMCGIVLASMLFATWLFGCGVQPQSRSFAQAGTDTCCLHPTPGACSQWPPCSVDKPGGGCATTRWAAPACPAPSSIPATVERVCVWQPPGECCRETAVVGGSITIAGVCG